MVNKNLKLILPLEFRDIHEAIWSPKEVYGEFFFKKFLTTLVAVKKDGFFATAEVGVRLGSSIENGLYYIGVLELLLKQLNFCVVMTNEDGRIVGMTENASEHMEIGGVMREYNGLFGKIYEVRFFKGIFDFFFWL